MTADFLVVDINIDPIELEKLYRGTARQVLAVSRDGRTVRFSASILQKHITREGIQGTFKIVFDKNHKFKEVLRLS